jgi:hypothetical protein
MRQPVSFKLAAAAFASLPLWEFAAQPHRKPFNPQLLIYQLTNSPGCDTV